MAGRRTTGQQDNRTTNVRVQDNRTYDVKVQDVRVQDMTAGPTDGSPWTKVVRRKSVDGSRPTDESCPWTEVRGRKSSDGR
jgi:hypothetical protein